MNMTTAITNLRLILTSRQLSEDTCVIDLTWMDSNTPLNTRKKAKAIRTTQGRPGQERNANTVDVNRKTLGGGTISQRSLTDPNSRLKLLVATVTFLHSPPVPMVRLPAPPGGYLSIRKSSASASTYRQSCRPRQRYLTHCRQAPEGQ